MPYAKKKAERDKPFPRFQLMVKVGLGQTPDFAMGLLVTKAIKIARMRRAPAT
jgi:hypothetical protein